jgi:ketosteroid isomerase-like protein
MADADERIARDLWDAVSKGDVERVERLCSPDLVWHTSGRGPRAGTVRGREQVLDHLGRIGEDADQFESTLEDVMVGPRYAALVYHVTGLRGDQRLESDWVLLLRISEGRLAEAWSIPRDQYAVDEFWSA